MCLSGRQPLLRYRSGCRLLRCFGRFPYSFLWSLRQRHYFHSSCLFGPKRCPCLLNLLSVLLPKLPIPAKLL